ncbi:MAG TPA: penicillin-binding protein 1C [Polyangiaceae bacterium]|nr:penicillin-binding protein 1C [Polyangiaceae bacterium]
MSAARARARRARAVAAPAFALARRARAVAALASALACRPRARAALASALARRRLALAALALALALAAPPLLLWAASYGVALPAALAPGAPYDASLALRDRRGALVRHVRAADGTLARRADPRALGPNLPRAIVAAEDGRFFRHRGVDPLAVARAVGQALAAGRVVSGASTLTQQLARTVEPRPPGLYGKLREMALALRIERSLSKEEILGHYAGRVAFGPRLRGVEAASEAYFGKPARELSLAEAALLAGVARGPTLYNPRRRPELARRRRDRVIDRLVSAGLASADEARRAKAEALRLPPAEPARDAPHFAQALVAGALEPGLGRLGGRATEIETTLDGALQARVEASLRARLAELAGRDASAAAALVLDNEGGEILAYVGSPDAYDEAGLGANDGVRALRQPGSALKPFVYELAHEALGWTPATALPDVELHFPSEGGDFRPRNYDGRLHGPVRLREALANSYNVPAAYAASVLGPGRLLGRLRELGFASFDRPAEHYGVALALGDGEVRMLDLAAAYAALARGGSYVPPRALRAYRDPAGAWQRPPPPAPRPLLDPAASAAVTDVLADPHARRAAFGEAWAGDRPYAVKTGTSKGFRDNWAVAYTRRVTVVAWVGNFDGRPMRGVSGVAGAGPIARDVLAAALELYPEGPAALVAEGALEEVEVCALSGRRPSPSCPHRVRERVPRGRAPREACSWHRTLAVDTRTGGLAGPGCAPEVVAQWPFEDLPEPYGGWGREAGRPLPPPPSPLCPPRAPSGAGARVRIVFPLAGARFQLDRDLPPERQRAPLRVELPAGAGPARAFLDQTPLPAPASGPWLWPLSPGPHRLRVEAPGLETAEVEVRVEGP